MNCSFPKYLLHILFFGYILFTSTEARTKEGFRRSQILANEAFNVPSSILILKPYPEVRIVKSSKHSNESLFTQSHSTPQKRGGKFLNLRWTPHAIQTKTVNRKRNIFFSTDHPLTLKPKRKENNNCVCIPHYLCKDGTIASGGLTLIGHNQGSKMRLQNFRNKTKGQIVGPKIIVNQYKAPLHENECRQSEECCHVPDPDSEFISRRDEYPVATPLPNDPFHTPQWNDDFSTEPYPLPIESCGIRYAYDVHGRIVNLEYPTDVVEFGEYPWQVALLKKMADEESLYLCGGVLISSQWVATVAHCLKLTAVQELHIRIGEWDVERKDEIYPHVDARAVSIVIHPDFDPDNLHNDIALIRLEENTDSRYPHITPACLPKSYNAFLGQKCWVSGWGKNFFGPQGKYQNALKEVDVPLLPRGICETRLRKTRLGSYFRLHPGFLCAGGEPGKDACTGDGGSPLVCDRNGVWYVVALVSWGIGCGEPGIPGVYTSMEYYMDWIANIIYK